MTKRVFKLISKTSDFVTQKAGFVAGLTALVQSDATRHGIRASSRRNERKCMRVLAKLCGIVIRLLKLRPFGSRLHAFYVNDELVVDLDEVRVVSGRLPDRAMRMVLAWARQHRREIL